MPIQANGAIVPQILRTLRDTVICIDLPLDVLLSEMEVARCFGLNCQPVREVFITLQEAGPLSICLQRGTVVRRISVAVVLDACFGRETASRTTAARPRRRARPASARNSHA